MKLNIVFYQPEIPGNTGSVIRTCYATKSKFHIIKPFAFDLYTGGSFHKEIKRSSANIPQDKIEIEVHNSYDEFAKKYGDKKIFYITRYGQHIYSSVDYKAESKLNDDEIWIMFGTESTGIPKSILQKDLERCMRIPMAENARSLNLSNSANIVIYEVLRQFDFENLSPYEVQKGADWILKND